jgi:hypothetical protein
MTDDYEAVQGDLLAHRRSGPDGGILCGQSANCTPIAAPDLPAISIQSRRMASLRLVLLLGWLAAVAWAREPAFLSRVNSTHAVLTKEQVEALVTDITMRPYWHLALTMPDEMLNRGRLAAGDETRMLRLVFIVRIAGPMAVCMRPFLLHPLRMPALA